MNSRLHNLLTRWSLSTATARNEISGRISRLENYIFSCQLWFIFFLSVPSIFGNWISLTTKWKLKISRLDSIFPYSVSIFMLRNTILFGENAIENIEKVLWNFPNFSLKIFYSLWGKSNWNGKSMSTIILVVWSVHKWNKHTRSGSKWNENLSFLSYAITYYSSHRIFFSSNFH